jgi:very-short-patch-repair endonuclease
MGKKARKAARIRKKTRKNKLRQFASKLEANTPQSELWFRSLYFRHYSISSDLYNVPFAGYIPDIRNKEYKYIIEIDGSIHNLESIKKKDEKKTRRYNQLGYKVIRVIAYNDQSYINAINRLIRIRGRISSPTKEYLTFLQNYDNL